MSRKFSHGVLITLLLVVLAAAVLVSCETAGGPQATATPSRVTPNPTSEPDKTTPQPPTTPDEEYPGPEEEPTVESYPTP